MTRKSVFDPRRPCGVEFRQSAQSGQQVNPVRREPELDHRSRLRNRAFALVRARRKSDQSSVMFRTWDYDDRMTRTGNREREYEGSGRPLSSHIRSDSTTSISRRSSAVDIELRSSPGSWPSR